jgi:hypothetical protein
MGDEAYRAYQKTGGQWLDNLTVVDARNVPPVPQPPPQPNSITIPDINLLPPDVRAFLLNPPIPPQPLPAK